MQTLKLTDHRPSYCGFKWRHIAMSSRDGNWTKSSNFAIQLPCVDSGPSFSDRFLSTITSQLSILTRVTCVWSESARKFQRHSITFGSREISQTFSVSARKAFLVCLTLLSNIERTDLQTAAAARFSQCYVNFLRQWNKNPIWCRTACCRRYTAVRDSNLCRIHYYLMSTDHFDSDSCIGKATTWPPRQHRKPPEHGQRNVCYCVMRADENTGLN